MSSRVRKMVHWEQMGYRTKNLKLKYAFQLCFPKRFPRPSKRLLFLKIYEIKEGTSSRLKILHFQKCIRDSILNLLDVY